MHALVLLCINQCTTFEVSRITDSKDMIHHGHTMYADTHDDQCANQI